LSVVDLNTLIQRASRCRSQVEQARGRRALLEQTESQHQIARTEQTALADWYLKAQTLLQQAAALSQDRLKNIIEPLLTQALRILLGPGAQFRLRYDQSRNMVQAHLETVDADGIEGRGTEVHGGGVLDVESVLLRLVFVLRLRLPRVLILDEPYRNVHGARALAVIEDFLEGVSRDLGMQVVVVTGNEDHSAPSSAQIIGVSKVDGASRCVVGDEA